jgi:hypothetical protein
MREHFQNLIMLLQPSLVKEVNMVKFRDDKSLTLTLVDEADGSSHELSMHYFLFTGSVKDLQRIKPDVNFWSFSMLRTLVTERSEELLPELVEKYFLMPYENLVKSKQSAFQQANNRFYLHPQIQREDPRIDREVLSQAPLNHSVNSFACLTAGRQQVAVRRTWELLAKYGLTDSVINAQVPTLSRWESSWDGIHYSLLLGENSFEDTGSVQHGSTDTCTEYIRGGKNLCCQVNTFQGINKCGRASNSTKNGEHMYWCKKLGYNFQHFEGGVSRMMTMIWLNSLCNANPSLKHSDKDVEYLVH